MGGYPAQQYMGGGGGGGGDPVYALALSEKVVIKERINEAEAVATNLGCCYYQENTYDVMDAVTGQKLFVVEEESGLCCRTLCKPYQTLQLNFIDPRTGRHVMTADRPFACPLCPAVHNTCQQQSYLYTGIETNPTALLGHTKTIYLGGCFTPTIGVHLHNQRTPFAYIEGPRCCFGGCSELCCDQPFPLSTTPGKSQDVGILVKERPSNVSEALKELLTDSDLYTLTFENREITPQQKTVILSSALLLDYLFFETSKPWWCSPVTGNCAMTCCYMYMCGMVCPCKIACGSEGDDRKRMR
eukprot:TRINITY_DN15989_c0_g1_i1.p1 TRINITY_DN15989_c0_g1~~TRINITY_DN15989_c0_g1_i1.p1  ORF type:complete len:300 (+),score=30.69 TRINITY_DN15989_c0_g1_i1:309-1208(+)